MIQKKTICLGEDGGKNLRKFVDENFSGNFESLVKKIIETAHKPVKPSALKRCLYRWFVAKNLTVNISLFEDVLRGVGCGSILLYPYLPTGERKYFELLGKHLDPLVGKFFIYSYKEYPEIIWEQELDIFDTPQGLECSLKLTQVHEKQKNIWTIKGYDRDKTRLPFQGKVTKFLGHIGLMISTTGEFSDYESWFSYEPMTYKDRAPCLAGIVLSVSYNRDLRARMWLGTRDKKSDIISLDKALQRLSKHYEYKLKIGTLYMEQITPGRDLWKLFD